jgi:hypothetical protein
VNENELRLFLSVFAVVGILYAWIGSGMLQKSNRDWWNELPQTKRVVFVLAIAATVAQAIL